MIDMGRVSRLEDDSRSLGAQVTGVALQVAKLEERVENMDERLERIEKSTARIESALAPLTSDHRLAVKRKAWQSKILWSAIGAVVVGLIKILLGMLH